MPDRSSWPSWRLAHWQVAVGLLYALSFVGYSFAARFYVPYKDDWHWVVAAFGRPISWAALFEPHNEHVIVLARLAMWGQRAVAGAETWPLCVLALASHLVVAWIVIREVRRASSLPHALRVWLIGVVAAVLFFAYHLQSTVFAAAMIFPLVQAWTVVAVLCAINASDATKAHASARWWYAAVAASVAAMVTTTSGLATPITVGIVLWARTRGWQRPAASVALAGVGAIAYIAMRQAADGQVDELNGTSLAGMARFFVQYFGAFVSFVSAPLGLVVGAALLALGVALAAKVVVSGPSMSRLDALALGLLLFPAANGAMAAAARSSYGAAQAAQSRYVTFTLVFWAGVMLLAIARLSAGQHERLLRLVVWSTTTASVLALPAQILIGETFRAKAAHAAVASLAVASGVDDDEWTAVIDPSGSTAAAALQLLAPQERPRAIRVPFGETRTLSPTLPPCALDLQVTRGRSPGQWRLGGTGRRDLARALVLDADGRVRGVARPLPYVDSPLAVHADFIRGAVLMVRSFGRAPGPWAGFFRSDAGGPEAIIGEGADGQAECQSVLRLK